MHTDAVVMEAPESLAVRTVELNDPGDHDVVVDISWSGISAGTERLIWSGRMPHFPGMGYPLVPGYESVGTVARVGRQTDIGVGQSVFVPGATCFKDVRGLFGASAAQLVIPAERAVPIPSSFGERGTMLALAATAHHAIRSHNAALPELIVGHGALGRLLARLTVAFGGAPTVWDTSSARTGTEFGYPALHPDDDPRRDYGTIFDVSGAGAELDRLVARLARGGEIVLAGFYAEPVSFTFPPAFMREARFRVAAEWSPADLTAVTAMVAEGTLSLDDLITHSARPSEAVDAYGTAFNDPSCLKMVLDWRNAA